MFANVLVETEELSREEWLKWRKRGIGGSDVSCLLGINKWKSEIELWLDKTNQTNEPPAENEAMEWGNIMEPVIRNHFAEITGKTVVELKAMLQHPEYPFMLADVDGITVDDDNNPAILEIKTASEFKRSEWEEDVPAYYQTQIQHYLCVTGIRKAYCAVLIGGNSFKIYEIDADDEIQSMLIAVEKNFWNKVQNMIRPEMDGSDAAKNLLDSLYRGGVAEQIVMPEEAIEYVDAYIEACAEEDNAKAKKQDASNHIKEIMGDYDKATPICIAVIIGVLLMPACMKACKRFALAGGATIAVGVFFLFELLFEREVVVATAETVSKLEDWQMFMCYIPPGGWGDNVTTYKTKTAVDILMGDYNPAFKMHFYIISIVLVITILNCLYGFGQMIRTSEKNRCKALILQSICTFIFLGLCILACFTAFWRDGSIQVSTLSAALMTIFFILLGVTAGIFAGSFLLGKRKFLSIWIPTIVAFVMTLLMYIGEMILLNGHLYNFGTGFWFTGLPGIILAPIDLLIIIVAASLTALIFALLNDYRRTHLIFVGGSVVVFLVVFLFAVILLGGNKKSIDNGKLTESGGSDEFTMMYSIVQVLEKTSGAEESTYRVGASLPSTDFSSMGQILTDKITQEWETYHSMPTE